MKRSATVSVLLVQLWLLSPMCCCWFKVAAKVGSPDCCCSKSDESAQKQAPAQKDSKCRCSESKIEILPQLVSVTDLRSQRLSSDQLLFVPAQVALSVVAEPSGPQQFLEWPPPLAVADRLARLRRLNL